MDLFSVLASVALIWGIAVVTPGPNFFITVQTAIGRSRTAAFFTVFGIGCGTMLWAVCGYFGITVLFQTAPWIYVLLKLVGAAYLTWLGIKLLCSGARHGTDAAGVSTDIRYRDCFRSGLLTNLSNPKTAAFVTSLFAATMRPGDPLTTGFAGIALMFVISLVWYSLVAWLFSLQRFRDGYRKARIWIEGIAGLIFIGFGAKLAAD